MYQFGKKKLAYIMLKNSSKAMSLWKKLKYKTNTGAADGFDQIWIYSMAEKL